MGSRPLDECIRSRPAELVSLQAGSRGSSGRIRSMKCRKSTNDRPPIAARSLDREVKCWLSQPAQCSAGRRPTGRCASGCGPLHIHLHLDLPQDRFSPRLRVVAHIARRMPASTKATRSPRRLRTMKSPRMGRSHARVRVTERSSASRGRARSSLHGVLRSDTNREDLHRWEASGTDSESHSFESRTPVTTRHHRDERNLPQR